MKNFSVSIFLISLFSTALWSQSFDVTDLSAIEIQKAKEELDRLNLMQNSEQPKPVVTESTVRSEENAGKDINLVQGKYGYDFFSSVPTSISAIGDLPLPNDYRISLRDQFTIILSGSKVAIFDLDVKLDGTILFPELGSISVVNETFGDVKAKLRNLVEQSYIGVQIDISIKELAAKKVTIVGAVKTPGTYLVNPFSTISSALGYSGGISEIGTLRKIRLIRTSGETFNFDLYKLLINGDRSNDVTIQAGDVIVVDPAEQFVQLSGSVKRPAIYEVTSEESLEDLVNFGLGFTDRANKTNINIEKLDLKSSVIETSKTENILSSLKNVLSVNVNQYVNKNFSNIVVEGAIKQPGLYDLSQYKTLDQLVDELEFVNAYPWLAVLEQFDEENLIKSSILFSLKDKNTYQSVKLLPNSRVFFANVESRNFDRVNPASKSLLDDFRLIISHKQAEYAMPVFGRFSIKEFIDYLGLDMSDINENATYISPLDDVVIFNNYNEMFFDAKKYNNVSFRSQVNDLIEVSINGAIEYPGVYKLKSNSTLADLFKLVGEFRPEAYEDGIIFTRVSIRDRQVKAIQKSKDDLNNSILSRLQNGDNLGDLSIIEALSETIEPEYLGRIAGSFNRSSETTQNTILLNGDTIFVPKNPNSINVLGEVLNPIAFEYTENMTVRSAISLAGGYQDFANKSKVYVIKANGLIEKAGRNIFTKNIQLEPGDSVIVPRQILTSDKGIKFLLPLTQLISDMAFSAAALESLANN